MRVGDLLLHRLARAVVQRPVQVVDAHVGREDRVLLENVAEVRLDQDPEPVVERTGGLRNGTREKQVGHLSLQGCSGYGGLSGAGAGRGWGTNVAERLRAGGDHPVYVRGGDAVVGHGTDGAAGVLGQEHAT